VAVYLSNGVVVTVNAVDLSSMVSSVTINRSFDELEVTAMGDSGHKFVKGLEASSIVFNVGTVSAPAALSLPTGDLLSCTIQISTLTEWS